MGTRIAVGVVLSRRLSRPPHMAWGTATAPPQAHSKGRHFLQACAKRKLWCLHGESASLAPGLPQAAGLRSTTATRTPAARALESKRRWEAADALTHSAVQDNGYGPIILPMLARMLVGRVYRGQVRSATRGKPPDLPCAGNPLRRYARAPASPCAGRAGTQKAGVSKV